MRRLQLFLQRRLWIGSSRSDWISCAQIFAERMGDKGSRRIQSSIDKDCASDGFEDIGPSSGISQATAQYTSWGTGIYDFDNDGWLDILIFHGGLIHLVPQEQSLFRGSGSGKFADVSRDAGPILDVKTVSRGACFADYDNDGKVDAFVVNLGAPATLLHNVSQNSNHWLTVKLKGKKSNRDGIGAHLEIVSGNELA